MTIAFLPGPTQSHNLTVNVALVGSSPRIGFFDDNGMLLDTSFLTYVSDAGSADVTCTLNLVLQATGMKLYAQAKQHSPITAWAPSANDTLASQTVMIGPTSHTNGVTSNFNVVVCEQWGSANAYWVDPTWPLTKVGSGGPKSVGAPQNAASYFYMTSLGSASTPKPIELYVNVAVANGQPYAWLSNAEGVCAGNILAMYPPVGSTSQDVAYWQLILNPGSMPSGYSVSVQSGSGASVRLPTNLNLYYGLSSPLAGSFEIAISASTGGTTSSTVNYYGETSAPGPIWTNS